ncbi:MAG: sigma-54-dependent transcriptional regulator [Lachnospiraceae bacterium]
MKQLFKILVVDDEKDARESMELLLKRAGYRIKTAATVEDALGILESEYYHLVITDIMMPGINGIEFLKKIKKIYKETIEVIMVTGYGSIETAVQTIKMGAFEYFIKGHSPEELLLNIEKVREIVALKASHHQRKSGEANRFLISSKSEKMKEVWDMVDEIADTNANVLITGETGVGKEIVANKIHQNSRRSDKLFVPVNCQNYPDELIEAELFGYEKGAFTGAHQKRIGKIEISNGGTIFLDEIGETSIPTQVLLLRTLESKRIERLGSNTLIDVDFRLVTATNRDLCKAVKEGTFRDDFLYRINTIEIRIPPLRERREDIPDLIRFFINKYEKETGKKIIEIEKETEKFLLEHPYYGNIRELKNLIERMVILSKNGVLRTSEINYSANFSMHAKEHFIPYREAKQQFERRYIEGVLETCDLNISKAAAKMGISRRQLFNKIKENRINTNR